MKIKCFILNAAAILFFIGCSQERNAFDPQLQSYSGPFIEEGFYSSESPQPEAVPAVAVRVNDGSTFVYGLLSYTCDQQSFAIYGITTQHLTDKSLTKTNGPSYTSKGKSCVVQTKIAAESATSIKITLTINGLVQNPYFLTSSSKDRFVEKLRAMISKVDKFSGFERDCMDSIQTTCDSLISIGAY